MRLVTRLQKERQERLQADLCGSRQGTHLHGLGGCHGSSSGGIQQQ